MTWQPGRGWTVYALEINLRQGGTSPPLALLANLDPGRYQPDPAGGRVTRAVFAATDPPTTSSTPAGSAWTRPG